MSGSKTLHMRNLLWSIYYMATWIALVDSAAHPTPNETGTLDTSPVHFRRSTHCACHGKTHRVSRREALAAHAWPRQRASGLVAVALRWRRYSCLAGWRALMPAAASAFQAALAAQKWAPTSWCAAALARCHPSALNMWEYASKRLAPTCAAQHEHPQPHPSAAGSLRARPRLLRSPCY